MEWQRDFLGYAVHRERTTQDPALSGLLERNALEGDGWILGDVEEVVGLKMIVAVRPTRIDGLRLDCDRDGRSLGVLRVVENGAVRLLKSPLHATKREANGELDDGMP